MKKWLLGVVFVLMGVGLPSASLAEVDDFGWRTFTSKDGKKTLVAIPVGYDRVRLVIHLRMKDGQIKKFDLSKFSINDQLFIEDNEKALSEMLRLMKVPVEIRSRFYQGLREELLRSHQAVAGSELVLDRNLNWLKVTQQPDGSWVPTRKVSMTALALLVYLGRGETPMSKEYGEAVTRAIVYLVNVAMKNGGKLADDIKDKHWPYEHAIATLALAEAYAICRPLDINIPKLKGVTKLAGDWILDHQHQSGSWDYGYDMGGDRGGDVSIAMWHVQALRACAMTGLWKPDLYADSVRSALVYVKGRQSPNGGVGYGSPNPSGENGFTLTGAGMYAYQMWYQGDDAVVRKGAKYIRKHTRFKYNSEHADLYRHYYHSLALKHRGGADWVGYNKLLGRQFIEQQSEEGFWKNVGGGAKIMGVATSYSGASEMSRHYRSCLCALILQVPYRYDWNAAKAPMGFGH